MSYAQPSPPTIHTLRRTRWSATAEQVVRGRGHQVHSSGRLAVGHALALGHDLDSRPAAALRGCRRRGRRRAEFPQLAEQLPGQRRVLVGGQTQPRPNSALSSNSEFDQAGPRPSRVLRPGRGRQVAAVDRGAAGGVGHQQAVAEQLGEQLQVGRLAAAGAGAGKLEQRFQELRAAHRAEVHLGAVVHGQVSRRTRVLALGSSTGSFVEVESLA
jgi:hypothetical protein